MTTEYETEWRIIRNRLKRGKAWRLQKGTYVRVDGWLNRKRFVIEYEEWHDTRDAAEDNRCLYESVTQTEPECTCAQCSAETHWADV